MKAQSVDNGRQRRVLSSDQRVLGGHLEILRTLFGWTVEEACFAFGMNQSSWTTVVVKGKSEPVKNPTIALLARRYDARPETAPQSPRPDMKALIERFGARHIGALLGRDDLAGYRWNKDPDACNASPSTRRLAMHLENTPDEELGQWEELINLERESRGLDRLEKPFSRK